MKADIKALAAEWFARRDAGLNDAEKAALEEWLNRDPRHREEFFRLQSAWSTFGKPARSDSTDALLTELVDRRNRRRRRFTVASVSSILILVAGFLQWPRLGPSAPAAIVVMHRAEERLLSDGSKITLRKGADIEVLYTKKERHVALRKGEALFEVAKDSSRAFVVRANGVDVCAVGTAFVVHKNDRAVDVLVTEGIVSVAPASHEENTSGSSSSADMAKPPQLRKPRLIAAGNRIVVENAAQAESSQPERVTRGEIDRRLDWRTPRVEFNGMPLDEAVALLNREAEGRTNLRLRIADTSLNGMRVSGTFRTDNLDVFALLMEAGFGIKIERTGDIVWLRKGDS